MSWNPFKSKLKPTEVSAEVPTVMEQETVQTVQEIQLPAQKLELNTSEIFKNFNYTEGSTAGWVGVNSYSFDGEKTPGELGAPINLVPDYIGLRLRAYEAELKSDVVKIITGKFFKWVVGDGLKIQPTPNEATLASEGITHNWVDYRNIISARFKTWAESTMADYSGMENLHYKASEAFDTSFLGGDSLVVLRVDDDLNPVVQVIDGQHLQNPGYDSKLIQEVKDRGNRLKHGIEIDKKGRHVAFFVRKDNDSFIPDWERIEAVGKESGCLMAWVVYGKKHRIDHVRGIPQITPILEKIDKLDRFTEASVGAAEERAKVPWFIEHNQHSDGENILINTVKQNGNVKTDEKTSWDSAELTKKEINISQAKTVYNMPIGSTLKGIFSQSEINYDAFFKAVFVQLCAACDIPPEVALQQYDSNYSASRAAINGWGYIIDIYRKKHGKKFYRPIYQFWLYCEVLKGNITAPGYLQAKDDDNFMVVEAYTEASFLGINLPHIDPLKEVNAVRRMLGDRTKGEFPLISNDQATEMLNNGDFVEIVKKFMEESAATKGFFDAPVIEAPGEEKTYKKEEPKKKKENE